MANKVFEKIKEVNEEICIICLSKIKDPVRPDQCHHIFCKICFILYAQSFDHCPVCKIKFSTIVELYSFKKPNKYKDNPFFNDLSGERLYRLSLKEMPKEICVVCKKNKDNDLLILCDMCGINSVHYYCDASPMIGIGYYMCPICRNRNYKQIKKYK